MRCVNVWQKREIKIDKMERGAKLRLMMLMEKAQSIVRYASPAECDALFVELAAFSASAVEKREQLRQEAVAISFDELIKKEPEMLPFEVSEGMPTPMHPCSPYGVCDPSANNEQLCYCCDDGSMPQASSGVVSGRNSNAGDSIEACAQCLCFLQRQELF